MNRRLPIHRFWKKAVSISSRTEIVLKPGGGLDRPTDKDQRIWVFLNDPKNTLPLTETPQKILSEKQNP